MQLMRKYKILKFLIGVIKEEPEDLNELFNLLGELRGVPQKFGQFLYLKDQEKYHVFEKLLDEGIPFKDSFLYARAKEL
ncbi:MAG: hypothetical protein AB2421_20555, partial [Thermotaleaceae bacterium]